MNDKMYKYGSEGSIIRELTKYSNERKKVIGDENVFDFSIGNPSVPCPNEVTKALINLLKNTDPVALHSYTNASGLDEVKKSIVDDLNQKYGVSESSQYLYITTGAAAALAITINALINPNDEVILLAPFFPEYDVYVQNALGKVVIVECDNKSFLPDFKKIKKAITCKTKMIIIDSPNNPTGVFYDEKIIEELSKILKEKEKEFNTNIYLLSDEPYRELLYVNKKYPFITKYYHNSIVNYSYSKVLSLPGERIGYILVGSNCNLKEQIFTAILGAGRALGYICESSLFQHLIPHCLNVSCDFGPYIKNKDYLYNELTKIGYEVIKPEGAFYLFVKALEEDANKFVENAKKYELILVPSDSFGYKGYVRIAYCVDNKHIVDSILAFKKLFESYKRGM